MSKPHRQIGRSSLIFLCAGLVCFLLPASFLAADEKITFDDHIKPLFQKRCAACHNGDKQSGGLDLTSYTNMMQGGGSGNSIEAGDSDSSYLYLLISHQETPKMPPGGTKLPDREIQLVKSWIDAGALETKTSVARKKKNIVVSTAAIGSRPEKIAMLPRMSLEPYFFSKAKGAPLSITSSPWSAVAAISAPRQILLVNTQSSSVVGTLAFPEGQANVVAFSRSGDILLAGGGRHGQSGKAVGWDVNSARRLFEIGDEFDNVLAADISPDHTLTAVGGPQKMLRVFSTATGNPVYEQKKHNDWITQIAFSPDGVLLASADRNGGLQLWEAETGNDYLTLAGHAMAISGLSWRGDGNVLASCSEDGNVRTWEVTNGGQIKNWVAHPGGITGIDFTRSGQIVTCGRDRTIKLWQQDGKLLKQFETMKDICVAISFCDETNNVIASSLNGDVFIWSSKDGKRVGDININPPLLSERIARAESRLIEKEAAYRPLESKFNTAQQQFESLQIQVRQQQELCSKTKHELAKAQAEINAHKARYLEASAQRETWVQQLKWLDEAVPLIADAKVKAIKAADLLPQNESLREVADKLALQHDDLVSQSSSISQQLESSRNSAKDDSEKENFLQDSLQEKQTKQVQATKRIDQLLAELTPLENQRNELQKQQATACKDVDEAKSQVAYWKAELEFHLQLQAKNEEWSIASQQVDEQEAILIQAKSRLKLAEDEYQKTLDEKLRLQKAADDIEASLQELQKRK